MSTSIPTGKLVLAPLRLPKEDDVVALGVHPSSASRPHHPAPPSSATGAGAWMHLNPRVDKGPVVT